MNFELTEEQMNKVLNYLANRPYFEVASLIQMLMATQKPLIDMPEDKNNDTDGTAV